MRDESFGAPPDQCLCGIIRLETTRVGIAEIAQGDEGPHQVADVVELLQSRRLKNVGYRIVPLRDGAARSRMARSFTRSGSARIPARL